MSVLNTAFLKNENALFVYGGFHLRLAQVTINSTYGYALTASAPPNLWANIFAIKVFLNYCVLWNNRAGIIMSTIPCLGTLICSPGSQSLVVKNSVFLGGNETRGVGGEIRFKIKISDDVNQTAFY